MPIRWHDRVFVAGQSSSGKSELLNLFFTQIRTQKVLLDTKGEFAIDGVTAVHQADQIDWEQPVIHFEDLSGELEEYDKLCYDIIGRKRRNVVICCHELGDLCHDQPNRTPTWVRQAIRKGNVFGDGWLSGSQRPVGMPRQARTEAQHVIQMVPALDPEDHVIVAKMMGLSDYDLRQLLDQAAGLSPTGQYSWVWYDKRERLASAGQRGLTIMPPLPENLRAQIIVSRTANV